MLLRFRIQNQELIGIRKNPNQRGSRGRLAGLVLFPLVPQLLWGLE